MPKRAPIWRHGNRGGAQALVKSSGMAGGVGGADGPGWMSHLLLSLARALSWHCRQKKIVPLLRRESAWSSSVTTCATKTRPRRSVSFHVLYLFIPL